ncbi:metal-dependent transcriptional regulator [bacterium]|nr:metal-dependent transcriptional regulator [bacterium]
MASLTVENYVKSALQIELKSGNEWVSTGALAEALDVSPGSVTSMLKTLSESNLAEYRPYEGVRLTDAGRKLAMRMLRRHRLIEEFLVKTLDLTWDQVHDEAEDMEHAVSDFLIDRIDEFLGCPETDPHGSPIPTAEGKLRSNNVETRRLTECESGAKVRLIRVENQAPELLRYLAQSGFELGSVATIQDNNGALGQLTAKCRSKTFQLQHRHAESLLVEEL